MKALIALLTCSLLCTAVVSTAEARPPRPREDAGVVRQVDHGGRNLTIVSLRDTSKTLYWDAETRFWKNGEESSSEAVTKGMVVKCSYRVPFVGPPSLTKVVIVAKAKKSGGDGK